MGIDPVIGSLDDGSILSREARAADAVINCASADHRDAVEAMLSALEGSDKAFVHTSASSIVGTRAGGELLDDVYDESTPIQPSAAREARVRLNDDVLAAAGRGVRAVIISDVPGADTFGLFELRYRASPALAGVASSRALVALLRDLRARPAASAGRARARSKGRVRTT